MKNVIESIKDFWKGIANLFKDEPASYYYYKMDGKNEPMEVCNPDDPKYPDQCGCKQTSDFTYDEDVKCEYKEEPDAEAPVPAGKSVSKADLTKMSKLELQVMAQNAGVILTNKENKQQIVNKLSKLAL